MSETPTCPACSGSAYPSDHGNYDHIHKVTALPPAKRGDSCIIRRGYAVGMDGVRLPQVWVFFDRIEPALIFGRAGRMSIGDIGGYGVYEAAQEVRFDARRRRDVLTLYVDMRESLDRRDDEAAAFARWVAGCDPRSSHFEPEAGRA